MRTRSKKKPAFKLRTEAFFPSKERRHRYGTGTNVLLAWPLEKGAQKEIRLGLGLSFQGRK
jgi:hypothetical protein